MAYRRAATAVAEPLSRTGFPATSCQRGCQRRLAADAAGSDVPRTFRQFGRFLRPRPPRRDVVSQSPRSRNEHATTLLTNAISENVIVVKCLTKVIFRWACAADPVVPDFAGDLGSR